MKSTPERHPLNRLRFALSDSIIGIDVRLSGLIVVAKDEHIFSAQRFLIFVRAISRLLMDCRSQRIRVSPDCRNLFRLQRCRPFAP